MALKARDKFIASAAIAQQYPSEVDANGYFVSHPETETDQVSDMAAFMKTLNKQGTDAAAVKTLLNISSGGDGIPVAAVIPWDSDSNVIPPGFLECDGSAISRTEYADLFGVIGTKYGAGDGSTTFNVPDYTDGVFLEGSDTAGTSHAAGLPNITGKFASLGTDAKNQISDSKYKNGDGAISFDLDGNPLWYYANNAYGVGGWSFDASQSNAIYGASATVQPKSSTTRYLIKFIPSVPESEASAAASASVAQAAAQAAESYAGSAGIPVGTLFPYAADTVTPPTGFLFCNGQAVSRTMYPDLFSVLGTTWGAGDGSTTFNLPKSEDLVLQGASATNPVGTYLSAGLPNITGSIKAYGYVPGATSGAISYTYYGSNNSWGGTGSSTPTDITIDASRSSAIYGASDTVQPPAACVKFIIKAYDGVTPGSAGIDLSQYASDLSNKASRGLDNLTDAGKDRFLGDDNFTIIYPNNGTAANPANVTINSTYIMNNPFPGYNVYCQIELFANNEWGTALYNGYFSNNENYGVGAFCYQHNDSNLVMRTGSYLLIGANIYANTLVPNTWQLNSNMVTAPCRVKVWKIGKAANS